MLHTRKPTDVATINVSMDGTGSNIDTINTSVSTLSVLKKILKLTSSKRPNKYITSIKQDEEKFEAYKAAYQELRPFAKRYRQQYGDKFTSMFQKTCKQNKTIVFDIDETLISTKILTNDTYYIKDAHVISVCMDDDNIYKLIQV